MRLGGIYDMKIQLVHLEIVKDQEVDLGMIRRPDDAFRAADVDCQVKLTHFYV